MDAHVMNLNSDHEGTQEWICPICGRVLLLETNPSHLSILVRGDSYASHSGNTGGLKITGMSADNG